MDFKLKSQNGRIRYYMAQKSGVVGNDTRLDSAEWMLREHKPYRTGKIEGFPVTVMCNGHEYFFEGEWPEPKKRRTKDKVCEG